MMTISNIIERIEKTASMILIAAMTIILFLNVIYRYFLHDPIFWANEASIYMMAWVTFLGGSLGLKYKSQASITMLVDRFKKEHQKIINIIAYIIILVFLAYLVYISSYWITHLSANKSSSLRIPMSIPYSCVPVGLTFAFIHMLAGFVEIFKKAKNKEVNTHEF